MINKISPKFKKVIYSGVTPEDKFSDFEFNQINYEHHDDVCFYIHTDIGSITVLDRMTDFGFRDTETGFRDKDNRFWLASGNFDIRDYNPETFQDAINLIKDNANTVNGYKR